MDGGINYTIHTFTTNGTFNVTGEINATVLVVGGGGGTGGCGSNCAGNAGGGGAGGIIYNTTYNATGNVIVIVGSGGAQDAAGQNSSFGTLNARGGGDGGQYCNGAGTAGGSGGGGGQESGGAGAGTANQGNNGGAAWTTSHSGGGGGGANGTGGTANALGGGIGGAGANYSITGVSTCYAGGGAGSTHNSITNISIGGCGGGNGQGKLPNGTAIAGTSGTNGTGGGGGARGESKTGGIGGNGIVIIRYQTPPQFNVTVSAPEPTGFYTYNDILENITCFGDLSGYILNTYLDGGILDSNYEVENNTPFIMYGYISDGSHLLYATCTNGTKTVTSASVDFIVQGAPKMNLTAPLDGTTNLSSTIAFGYYGMSLEPEVSCVAYLDDTLNLTEPLYQTGTFAQFIIDNIANGAHTIEINCTDSYTTEGSTGVISFEVYDSGGGGSGNVTGSTGFWMSRLCMLPSKNHAPILDFFTRLGR
jgi:hypothetical protein